MRAGLDNRLIPGGRIRTNDPGTSYKAGGIAHPGGWFPLAYPADAEGDEPLGTRPSVLPHLRSGYRLRLDRATVRQLPAVSNW